MKGIRGSFLGFTYNGIHSSIMGVTRINESTRYNESLLPSCKDRSADRLGNDGQFFYGTTYTKRDIVVNYAFEGLTAEQQSLITRHWLDDKIHALIFDEAPYKVYYARIVGTAAKKFLPFSKDEQLIQRGEGSFVFTCYFPYALSRFEYQEDYIPLKIHEWAPGEEQILEQDVGLIEKTEIYSGQFYYDLLEPSAACYSDTKFDWVGNRDLIQEVDQKLDPTANASFLYGIGYSEYYNFDEWIEASKIPSNNEYGKIVREGSKTMIKLYNAGDVPIPFKVWFIANKEIMNFSIKCGEKEITIKNLQNTKGSVYYYVIDFLTHSIEGHNALGQQTGYIYNPAISSGQFFLLPMGESTITIDGAVPHKIEFHYWYL